MPQPALSVSPASWTLLQDVVHRVADRARDGAVDGRGGGLVLERAGVGGHAAGGNRPAAQRPQETLVPVLAHVLVLDVRERARDALVGIVHRLVDGRAVLRGQAILLVPDIERCFLEGNRIDVFGFDLHDGVHVIRGAPMSDALSNGSQGMPAKRSHLLPEPRAQPVPAALDVTVRPLKPPPDRVTLIACGEHKILCRGQKPNDGLRGRQAARPHFVVSLLLLLFQCCYDVIGRSFDDYF